MSLPVTAGRPGAETPAPDHLVPLPASRWALWRCVVLRGAGFPAAKVLQLARPESAAQADRVLDLERQAAELCRQAMAALDLALAEPPDRQEAPGGGDRARLRAARRRLLEGRRPKEVPATNVEPIGALRRLESAASGLRAARARLAELYAADLARTSTEIERLAGWGTLREAVAWQSPGAVGRALDELVRRAGTPRNSALRRHEELVASYLQRYCVKNDTIGFYGPVGWAELGSGGSAVSVRPGSSLLARREVYFESWAIDALAARLGGEPGIQPALAPRLRLGLYLSGRILHQPGGRETRLTDEQAAVLAECDGRRTARTIAAALAGGAAGPALATAGEVYELLAELARMDIVVWTLEAPLELRPEDTLRRQLAGVEPAALRERLLAQLEELDDARLELARAAGDAASVQLAMRRLEETFTRLTGAPARRRHGQFYAARGLVYEECRRHAEVRFGPELTRRLEPLGLLLQGARWLAGELACRVERRLRALHQEICRGGPTAVDSFLLVARVLPALFYKQERDGCFVELERELQQRWARVLTLPALPPTPEINARIHRTVHEIAERFSAAFGEVQPAWSLARYFSPDVMIAARGEAAFRAGEFQLVLGEIHASNTLSWSSFVSQHLQPERLLENVERDLGDGPTIVPQLVKEYFTQRNNISLVPPGVYRYEIAEQAPSRPACRSLPAAEVIVERDDRGLTARTRDGWLRFPAIELFGLQLTEECSRLLGRALPPCRHQPRLTLDGLVIARERWRFDRSELDFAAERDPAARFLAVRRWARRHRLPRYCFYRAAGEDKPCYLDLASPIYVNLFARLVRAAAATATAQAGEAAGEALLVEEMLPAIEDTWLTDAGGNRYTCELRMVAVQPPGI
jgi:hypothetical protein